MKQPLSILFGAFLFLQTTPVTITPSVNFFSPIQDIQIGTASSIEADKQLTIIRGAQLNQYIRSITQRVLTGFPSTLHYQVRIVNSPDISSLGFPNGTLYVYRGLLD